MGYKASELIQQVAENLLDYGAVAADQYVRWSQAEHLANLNAGQRQIVAWKPDANDQPLVYKLVAGTEQRLPDGTNAYQSVAGATHPEGIQLIRPVKNKGTAGTTNGNAIEMGDIGIMDSLIPDWHTGTGNATVQTIMYDPQDPTRFFVYPPQPAANQGYVELIIATIPADVVAAVGPPISYAVAISLRDIFRQPLEDYMMYRAYLKDAGQSLYAAQRAQIHLEACLTALGRKDLIQRRYSPSRPVLAAEGDQQ